jgi:hypothetical protein
LLHWLLLQQPRQTPLPSITQQFGVGAAQPSDVPVQHDAFGMHWTPHGLKPLAHWHWPPEQTALSGQSTHRAPLMPQVSFELCRHSPGFPGPLVQHPPAQLT